MNNKILKTVKHGITYTGAMLLFLTVNAQSVPISTYGLQYINDLTTYNKSIENNGEKEMISLNKIPGIQIDLRYASAQNFMHKKLYPSDPGTTYIRKPAFDALDSVVRELAAKGYTLVVLDAYRPYSVTIDIWNSVKDERYAANPAKGSGHNRGLAVDVTLADAKTRNLVPMPTSYDDFTNAAHQDFTGGTKKALANRELLKSVMVKYGFVPLFSEWWHYSWPRTGDFEVLDLSFEQLGEGRF